MRIPTVLDRWQPAVGDDKLQLVYDIAGGSNAVETEWDLMAPATSSYQKRCLAHGEQFKLALQVLSTCECQALCYASGRPFSYNATAFARALAVTREFMRVLAKSLGTQIQYSRETPSTWFARPAYGRLLRAKHEDTSTTTVSTQTASTTTSNMLHSSTETSARVMYPAEPSSGTTSFTQTSTRQHFPV